jgi:hypothetical protein
MGASICWVAAEADTQFAIFDLFVLKKQCLFFFYLLSGIFVSSALKKQTSYLFLYHFSVLCFYDTSIIVICCHFTTNICCRNELPRSRAAKYQNEFLSINPDAEHRGILLIKKNLMFDRICQTYGLR